MMCSEVDGQLVGTQEDTTTSVTDSSIDQQSLSSVTPSAYITENGEHRLRHQWQFLTRPKEMRRKGQNSSHDWQKEMVHIGGPVGTVERFWTEMNNVFKRSFDANVFMFREGIEPMWEDPAFAHGGSVNFSFSGADYAENARQSFLLSCLLIIGAQLENEEDVLCGCTFGWKQGLCRVELWLSTDQMAVLNAVAGQFLTAMREFHTEFYRNLATRVSYDCKAFKSGGDKRLKAEETSIEKIVYG